MFKRKKVPKKGLGVAEAELKKILCEQKNEDTGFSLPFSLSISLSFSFPIFLPRSLSVIVILWVGFQFVFFRHGGRERFCLLNLIFGFFISFFLIKK